MEYLCYSIKSDFLFKNVKIPLSYFYKILNDYFEAGKSGSLASDFLARQGPIKMVFASGCSVLMVRAQAIIGETEPGT